MSRLEVSALCAAARRDCLAIMVRIFAFLALWLTLWLAGIAHAGAMTLYGALDGDPEAPAVTIYSAIDEAIARPLIAAFQQQNRAVAVRYVEAQTVEIYDRVVRETDAGRPTADLALSSAMDLQMKLANDGFARAFADPALATWPRWANWRNTAIGLTYEPSVIVYHKPDFAARAAPQTHAEFEAYLREHADRLYGRVGTYDIERAGVGLLFLARDLENHRDIWSLVRAMGAAGVKLYSTSSAILERVSDGRFELGYNILGSYAAQWAKTHPELGIVMPQDYTVVMTRVALLPAAAGAPELGERFLRFLMSREGQQVLAQESGLPAIHPDVSGDNTAAALERSLGAQLRPVPLTPALMVYLDQAKRSKVVERWNRELRAQ